MNIRTPEGIIIHCLPDCAKCNSSGKSPEKMSICPDYFFDDFGNECVPELCDEYCEVSENDL